MAQPDADRKETRAELVERLRHRYLKGTLDEVLFPEDPPIERLLRDLFPDAPRRPLDDQR